MWRWEQNVYGMRLKLPSLITLPSATITKPWVSLNVIITLNFGLSLTIHNSPQMNANEARNLLGFAPNSRPTLAQVSSFSHSHNLGFFILSIRYCQNQNSLPFHNSISFQSWASSFVSLILTSLLSNWKLINFLSLSYLEVWTMILSKYFALCA